MVYKYLVFFLITVIIGALSMVGGLYFFHKKTPSDAVKKQHFQSKENIKNPQYATEPLTLEKIFSEDHSWTATISAEKLTTMIATGDVIPARSVNSQEVKRNNFIWPYEKIGEILKRGDVTFINLEAPLTKDCPAVTEGMIFCGSERNIDGLIFAGVDIVNLANNHLANYGQDGIDNTIKLLQKGKILYTGIKGPAIIEKNGRHFSFLGYNDISGGSDLISVVSEEKIIEEISAAKEKSEIIIVTFHWGDEYTEKPNLRQKKLGHLAIDAGADLVIGNHPHWVQTVEIYHGKLISYAHGNLVFDQMWSEETKKGVIGRYVFYQNKLIDVEFFPTYITDYGQPQMAKEEMKKQILLKMKNLSLENIN